MILGFEKQRHVSMCARRQNYSNGTVINQKWFTGYAMVKIAFMTENEN
jgi:hypothetical protein